MTQSVTSVHPPETPVQRFDVHAHDPTHSAQCLCRIHARTSQIEVDAPPDLPVTLGTAWRHSGWAGDRQRVANAIYRVSGHTQRVGRFAACGDNPIVLQSDDDPGQFKIVTDTCKDRFCLPCSRLRAHAIATALQTKMANEPHRFITLTLRSNDESLRSLLKLLYASFRRLRTAHVWAEGVKGGAAFLETKWNSGKRRWHPHLHILVHGKYMPHAALKAAWFKASLGSEVVDIRMVKSHSHIVRYVTKYVTKGFDSSYVHDACRLEEAVRTLKGVRTVLTFGDWRSLHTTEKGVWEGWTRVDTLEAVVRRNDDDPMAEQAFVRGLHEKLLEFVRDWIRTHDPPKSRRTTVGGCPATKQLRLW